MCHFLIRTLREISTNLEGFRSAQKVAGLYSLRTISFWFFQLWKLRKSWLTFELPVVNYCSAFIRSMMGNIPLLRPEPATINSYYSDGHSFIQAVNHLLFLLKTPQARSFKPRVNAFTILARRRESSETSYCTMSRNISKYGSCFYWRLSISWAYHRYLDWYRSRFKSKLSLIVISWFCKHQLS